MHFITLVIYLLEWRKESDDDSNKCAMTTNGV